MSRSRAASIKPVRALTKNERFLVSAQSGFYLSSEKLRERIQALGYKLDSLGICKGFIEMWVQAVLVEEEQHFFDRIKFISQPDFEEQIKSFKKKVKSKKPLTKEDEKIIDVYAFCDGIELYLNAFFHKDIFNKNISQRETEAVSKYTSSKLLEEKGGRATLFSKSILVSQKELEKFLTNLGNQISHLNPPIYDIALTLNVFTHISGLRFIPEKNAWYIIDQSVPGPIELTSEALATYIQTLWSGSEPDEKANNITCHLELHTSQASYAQLAKKILPKIKFPTLTEKTLKQKTKDGVTLTTTAVRNKQFNLINELVELKTDLNQPNRDGTYPIHFASEHNDPQLIHQLKNAGADLEKTNKIGASPLHYAVVYNALDVINTLIDYKVNTESTDDENATPLLLAAENKYTDAAILLIDRGANIHKRTAENFDALVFSIAHEDILLIHKLVKFKADINFIHASGDTPLHIAIKNQKTNSALALLKYNIAVNILDNDKNSPLFYAVKFNLIHVISELIKHGANVNYKNPNGLTPLDIAIDNENIPVMQLLAKNSADLNSLTDGTTALEDAIIDKKWVIVNELIKLGANCTCLLQEKNPQTLLDILRAINDITLIKPESVQEQLIKKHDEIIAFIEKSLSKTIQQGLKLETNNNPSALKAILSEKKPMAELAKNVEKTGLKLFAKKHKASDPKKTLDGERKTKKQKK